MILLQQVILKRILCMKVNQLKAYFLKDSQFKLIYVTPSKKKHETDTEKKICRNRPRNGVAP